MNPANCLSLFLLFSLSSSSHSRSPYFSKHKKRAQAKDRRERERERKRNRRERRLAGVFAIFVPFCKSFTSNFFFPSSSVPFSSPFDLSLALNSSHLSHEKSLEHSVYDNKTRNDGIAVFQSSSMRWQEKKEKGHTTEFEPATVMPKPSQNESFRWW